MEPGIKAGVIVASGGAIRTKDGSYRSVKNGAVLSVVETYCSGTRQAAA